MENKNDFNPFGRYELISKLGTGGMGDVYKAYDPSLKRHVALKILRNENPEVLTRFLREARAQAKVEHTNICKIYEAGEIQNRQYIAMQYIEGKTLTQLRNDLTLDEKIKIMKDVALGLQAAHRQGLIHRDVKSSNIILNPSEDGQWKPFVMDFGIAREQSAPGITSTGMVIGTPYYMSPEQAKGKINDIDRRSDIYSMGITLFELLSGEVPFKGDTPVDILMKIIQKDPPSLHKIIPKIPVDLETIVMKCIEKDPNRRYGSAKELAEDLQRYLDGDPITARQPTLIYRLKRKVIKFKWATVFLIITFLTILISTVLWLQTKSTAAQRTLIAQQLGQEVEKIESIIQYTHLLPLHNITGEKNQIRERIKRIEQKITEVGNIARGPGHYAMGRGYVALQEYIKAKNYLQLSWEAGYQTPEVAFELGRVLGELYLKESEKANRIYNREMREIRQKEVETRFRKPAVHFLRYGAKIQSESSAYIEALIAFYEKDYGSALTNLEPSLKKASQDTPWLYRSKLLKGNIYYSLGKDKINHEKAEDFFNQAETSYLEVTKIGESDIRGHLGLGSVLERKMMIKFFSSGGDIQSLAREAIKHCENALRIDPEIAEIHAMKSSIFRWLGRYQMTAGENALPTFKQSITSAKNAIKIHPENFEAFTLIGITNRLMGQYKMNLGQDPTSEYQLAIQNFNQALSINPTCIMAFNGLGNVYVRQSQFEINQGKNPQQSLTAAINHYQEALQINPNIVNLYNGLACAFWFKGQAMVSRGQEPLDTFTQAVKNLEIAIKNNPGVSYFYSNLGFVLYDISKHELNHGLDPIDHVNHARTYLKKALELNPKGNELHLGLLNVSWVLIQFDYWQGKNCEKRVNEALNHFRKGLLINPNFHLMYVRMIANLVIQARYLLDRAKSPLTVIRKADNLLMKVNTINPNYHEIYTLKGEIELLKARWNLTRQQNPKLYFKKSEASLQQAIRLNPRETSIYLTLSRLYHRTAEWEMSRNRPAPEHITKGLSVIQKALSINPNLAEAYALKGILEMLMAENTQNKNQNQHFKEKARSSLLKGITINQNLKKLYKQYLKRLRISP